MHNTWIVVAHRGGARVFEAAKSDQGLKMLHDIAHAQGKLKDKDLGTDRPGRGIDSHGARTSFEQEQGLAAHVTEQFARELGALLDAGRIQKRYDKLVLVAEPHFLGILRAALSHETAALVTAVNKDLGHLDPRELARHLEGIVRIRPGA